MSSEDGALVRLAQAPLLAGIAPAEIERLEHFMSRFELDDGDHLFRQGDESSRMYVIESGHIDVEIELSGGGSRRIARLGPGENLGENSLLAGTRRSASAIAHGPSTGWTLYRAGFEMLRLSGAAGAVELMARLTEASAARLRSRYEEIAAELGGAGGAFTEAVAFAGAAQAPAELASPAYLRGLLCFHEFFDDSQIGEVIAGARARRTASRRAAVRAGSARRTSCCWWCAAPSTSRCAARAERSGCGSPGPGASWDTSARWRAAPALSPRTRASG